MENIAPYLGPALGVVLSKSGGSSGEWNGTAQTIAHTIPGFKEIQALVLRFTGLDILFIALCFLVFDGFRRLIQYIYEVMDEIAVKWLMTEFTIQNSDPLSIEIFAWLAAQENSKWRARSMTVQSIGPMVAHRRRPKGFLQRNSNDSQDKLRDALTQGGKRQDLALIPSVGRHYFFPLGWRPFVFEVPKPMQAPLNPLAYELALGGLPESGRNSRAGAMIIRCLGWSDQPLTQFIALCRRVAKEESRGKTAIWSFDVRHDWKVQYVPSRTLNTIELEDGIMEGLVQDMAKYLKPSTAKSYHDIGIPYRRGYLLYGLPGTGKSSISRALAAHFDLALYNLSLGQQEMNDDMLAFALNSVPSKCMVLLEDIDSSGVGREKKNGQLDKQTNPFFEEYAARLDSGMAMEEDPACTPRDLRWGRPADRLSKVTLSGLLNAIDGTTASEGRIIIMTTNNIEVLDSALVRPGRVDKRINMPAMSARSARRIFLRMCAMSRIGTEELGKLADAFVAELPDNQFTPAEVQGYLLEHMHLPQAAVAGVRDWVEKMDRERLEAEKEKDSDTGEHAGDVGKKKANGKLAAEAKDLSSVFSALSAFEGRRRI